MDIIYMSYIMFFAMSFITTLFTLMEKISLGTMKSLMSVIIMLLSCLVATMRTAQNLKT